MSQSSCVSNGEHNNADDDVSCGSTDDLTSNQLSHISTRPISPLADAYKLVLIPERSTLTSNFIAGIPLTIVTFL